MNAEEEINHVQRYASFVTASKLEEFLLELGDDFAFIGRQRRPMVSD